MGTLGWPCSVGYVGRGVDCYPPLAEYCLKQRIENGKNDDTRDESDDCPGRAPDI